MSIVFSSATQLAAAIQTKQISATEVLEAHLSQIEQYNSALNAIVILDIDRARQQAREADIALARGDVWGRLHGVPFTLKDAHATAGMRTTTGFPPLDHVPQEDSPVTARLKAAGGILMGKTNVATILADYQSSNPIFGRTNNPWQIDRTPGGSSGGAAAAITVGMTPFDIGTDLSGSIRIPAHFCGVMGLKPTEHRVSLTGLIPGLLSPRSVRIMSCIGPMARTVEDLALLHSIIAGADESDPDVPPVVVDTVPELDLKPLRIAFATIFPGLPIATEIQSAIGKLATQLSPLCAVVEAPPLPSFDSIHARFDELVNMIVGAFQPETPAQPTTLAQYLEALHYRDQSILAWEQFFDQWDILLCPVAMMTAFPHCEAGLPLQVDNQSVEYWSVGDYCSVFNYTGHPAVALPYQQDSHGLPIGIQLVGKRWSESRLLAIAASLTQATGEFQRPPGY